MKKKLLVHVAVALCCLAGVANAQESTIGVYLDATGTSCTGSTAGGVLQGSIWINLAGAAAGGITGAEFRIDYDNRSDLAINFAADPTVDIVIGDPFDQVGVNMAYSSCQAGSGGRIVLATFTVIENSPVIDTWFTLRKNYWPSNHVMDCPMLTLCDAPVYTAVCVSPADSDHWRAVLNPSAGVSADCSPVAVTPSTWSQVKGIFAN